MIKSMTGFGRGESADGSRRYIAEAKTVNHRYLDVAIRMPKNLNCFDSYIRALLKEYVERGKVDIFITCADDGGRAAALKCDYGLAEQYLLHLRQLAERFGIRDDVAASTLLGCPEIFSMDESSDDADAKWEPLEAALRMAFSQLSDGRAAEGARLAADMEDKLAHIEEIVNFIEGRAPQIVSDYRARLVEKVHDLLEDAEIDESRIAAEVTVYADKVCVDEELVRLKSHIAAARDTLSDGGAVGRRLDFLVQEMNREANTILSKANDVEISAAGVNLKTDIEKLREQVQNLE